MESAVSPPTVPMVAKAKYSEAILRPATTLEAKGQRI